jgi:putative membrane protein
MAALVAAAVAGCESRPAENTGTDAGAGSDATATGTSGRESIGMMERQFIEDQLQDGQAEVQLGELASTRGSSADVKEFGEMMVRDHTKAGEELKSLVQSENVQIEQPDEAEHKDLHERLSKLSGAEFDREYIDAMVEDHEEAVNELERHVDSDNARLKQFASSTLPVVRQHLERARQLKEQLDNRPTP